MNRVFLKIWNSRVNFPTKYEQFINGDELRILEIYSSSENCLNHINAVKPFLHELLKKIEFIRVSIYGSVSEIIKESVADLDVIYFERIGSKWPNIIDGKYYNTKFDEN